MLFLVCTVTLLEVSILLLDINIYWFGVTIVPIKIHSTSANSRAMYIMALRKQGHSFRVVVLREMSKNNKQKMVL